MQRLQNVGNKIILGMRPRSCSVEVFWGLTAGERRGPTDKFKLSQFALTLQATCTAASVTLRQHSKSVYKSAACVTQPPSGGVVTDKLGPHCGIFSVSFPGSSSPLRRVELLRVIRFKKDRQLLAGAHEGFCC